jgi:type II secretory pathway pseudopilin PulG
MKKSQTATEYMIVLAVIIIIAVIVVLAMGGFKPLQNTGNMTKQEFCQGKMFDTYANDTNNASNFRCVTYSEVFNDNTFLVVHDKSTA